MPRSPLRTYLPAQALPGTEPGDPGGLRGLRADQQQVASVAVELRGGVQHRPPPLGRHQRGDAVADLLVQCGELVLPPVVVLVVVLGWVLVCVLVLIGASLSRPDQRCGWAGVPRP